MIKTLETYISNAILNLDEFVNKNKDEKNSNFLSFEWLFSNSGSL